MSGIFIVQFYNLTRHYIVISPDNSETIKGDAIIGKYWSMFWERVKRIDRLYYSGESLKFKFSELNRLFPNVWGRLMIAEGERSIILKSNANMLSLDELLRVETMLQCKLEQKEDIYFLYIEDVVFYFPEFLRKPFSQCPKCMATPFGTAIYFTINYFDRDFLSWTAYCPQSLIFFWILFIISLSAINNYIYSKIPK